MVYTDQQESGLDPEERHRPDAVRASRNCGSDTVGNRGFLLAWCYVLSVRQGPLAWLRSLLEDTNTDSPSGTAAPERSTTLYECSACETVYISEAMEACPECERSLDQVPNERELGLD